MDFLNVQKITQYDKLTAYIYIKIGQIEFGSSFKKTRNSFFSEMQWCGNKARRYNKECGE